MPCTCEKKSYLDSYEVEKDKIKKSDPTLSEHDVRLQLANLFRPKFRVWKEADKIEKKGEKVYENGEFAFNENGEMYYPKTGETADGLHTNQKRLSELPGHSADEYSLEDHRITRLAEETIKAGASVFVTSYNRSDGTNRDIIEFRYNTKENKGVIRVVTTESDGEQHSYNRIKEIAQYTYPDLQKTEPTKEIFALSDKPLAATVAQRTVDTIQYAGKQTVQEIVHTARSVRHYIENKKEGSVLRQKQEHPTPIFPVKERRNIFTILKEKAQPIIWKQNKINIMTETKNPEKKKKENPLMAPGSLQMRVFASEKRVRLHVSPDVKKSIVRHEKKLKRIIVKSEKRAFTSVRRERPAAERKIPFVLKHESLRRVHKRTEKRVSLRMVKSFERAVLPVEYKKSNRRKSLKEIMQKKVLEIKKLEMRRNENIVRLINLSKQLIRIKERMMHKRKITFKTETLRMSKAELSRKLKEQVMDFSIAVILWLLIQSAQKQPGLKLIRWLDLSGGMPRRKNSKDVGKVNVREGKPHKVKEPARWLIAAIIRYLAMIREQGAVQSSAITNQSFSPSSPTVPIPILPFFPSQGVIFASVS